MCGIAGYIGNRQAQPIVLNALRHLEYRGYDSSGIAVRNGSIKIYKDQARVEELQKMAPLLEGTAGIGHTRWATHGEPSRTNAHPHCDCTGRIVVVHNGVIINYQKLKEQLIEEGHHFVSETDTEVIPHLIERYYQNDIGRAIEKALTEIEGSYAIIVLTADDDRIVVAKNGSPVIIGIGDKEKVIASDIPALLEYTDRVIYLEDGDITIITQDDVRFIGQGKDTFRAISTISWNADDVQKGGYEYFMIKEIREQPRVIRDTISGYLYQGHTVLPADKMGNGMLILGCGTSYHAGLIGKYVIEDLLDIPVRIELASEVNHRERIVQVNSAIAITQSGETADVLTAIKKLKKAGSFISVITNVRNSSASRLADETIHTFAGPEISVAATKSFIAQLIVLYQLVLSHPGINDNLRQKMELELRLLPNHVQRVLDNDNQINYCAMFLSQYNNAFFIGRGINYPVAMEGALKLKEISYIHAEGYASGELKHGPFSLLQSDTPVVAIVARDQTYDAMLTNIKEVKSRKSPVIAVVSEEDSTVEKLVDLFIKVPDTVNIFSPVVNTVVLQLLSYYAARFRTCPIDFPRNLAKSVTVE